MWPGLKKVIEVPLRCQKATGTPLNVWDLSPNASQGFTTSSFAVTGEVQLCVGGSTCVTNMAIVEHRTLKNWQATCSLRLHCGLPHGRKRGSKSLRPINRLQVWQSMCSHNHHHNQQWPIACGCCFTLCGKLVPRWGLRQNASSCRQLFSFWICCPVWKYLVQKRFLLGSWART